METGSVQEPDTRLPLAEIQKLVLVKHVAL